MREELKKFVNGVIEGVDYIAAVVKEVSDGVREWEYGGYVRINTHKYGYFGRRWDCGRQASLKAVDEIYCPTEGRTVNRIERLRAALKDR